MAQGRSFRKIVLARLAAPLLCLPLFASCSSAENEHQAADEDEGLLEPEEEENILVDIEGEEPILPDDSLPEPEQWPWTPTLALPPVYTCAKCTDSNCLSATATNRKSFAVKQGVHLYGGMGNDRGIIADSQVALNRGIAKQLFIGNETTDVVFAFRPNMTELDSNGARLRLSGWVRLKDLAQPMQAQSCNNPPRPLDKMVYRVKGPDTAKALYDKYNKPEWSLRVDPGGKPNENLLVHYLVRRDSGGNYAVNVTQGLPTNGHAGIANDAFTIFPDASKNPKFRGTYAHTDNLEAKVLLWAPFDPNDPTPKLWTGCGKSRCYTTFIYVRISKKRYGWIAKRVFTTKVTATAAGADLDAGMPPVCGDDGQACCNGNVCSDGFICNGSTCMLCGGLGEPCCATGCVDGICVNGTCQPPPSCGDAGQPCCAGACNTDRLLCDGTQTCIPCGNHAQVCCPSGAACNDPSNSCKNGACGSVCYARCVDGSLQGPYDAASAADCLAWSDIACSGHNGKGRVELNMTNIFDNMQCGGYHQMCCAADKCNGSYTCKAGPSMYWKWCSP